MSREEKARAIVLACAAGVLAWMYLVAEPRIAAIKDPLNIAGAADTTAPAFAEAQYGGLDQCLGSNAYVGFAQIRWVMADSVPGRFADDWSKRPTMEYAGAWDRQHHTIIIKRGNVTPWLVRHELVHARLLYGGHPLKYFNQKCGTAYFLAER